MAKFEIPRSSLQVTKGQATNVTPLTMPYNIVQNLGSNINQAGQVFEQIKKDQRVLEDENRFYEIRSEISKNADAAVLQSSKMLSIDEAEANLFKAYEIDVSNESKGVQKLVNQYINLNRDKDRSVVYKAVMSKAAEISNQNDHDFLKNNLLKRTSPINSVRAEADDEFKLWFNNPSNAMKRNPNEHSKLQDEYEELRFQIIVNNGAKMDSFQTLLNKDEILEKFGPQYGEILLKKAENAFISNVEQEILDNNKEVDARTFAQATIFSEFANKIQDNVEMPSILELHDSLDAGDINQSQYEALLDMRLNPDKISDEFLINAIDNQIIVASTVNEMTDIENNLFTAKEILANTNIRDLGIIKKLITQFKQDPKKHDDYKDFYKILQINMGDIGGFADVLTGAGGLTEENKLATQDALNRYKNFVANGDLPEQAYLKVIKTISKDTIPDIYSANLQPINMNVEDIGEAIKKKPKGFFEDEGNKLAIKLKNKEISREEFLEDINRLDLMKEVFELRQKVFGNIDLAIAPKAQASVDFGSILKSIIEKRGDG